jgi:predicted RecA/RadA family phage recombinase
MATNFVQDGKNIVMPTVTEAESGDAFVVGDYLPCVLLTDAETASPYNATVQTEGIFRLSCDGSSSAISAGDLLYWTDKDTPLDKDTTQKPFGIALEATTHATAAINVRLHAKSVTPVTVMGDITDPGDGEAIPVTTSGVCAMTSTEAGGETRTLAIPSFIGQQLILTLDVDGGDVVVTAASTVDGSNDELTFDAAGETLVLVGTQIAGVLAWRILENIGSVGLAS